MKRLLLTLILTTGCGGTHHRNSPPSSPPIPRNVELEFEKIEKLKMFKRHRPERWKRWRRTIRPRRKKNLSRPKANTSQLQIEIDQNIEWYCIKHRRNPRQCRRHTQPILNRCTRKNGNNLNRKVLKCIKRKLKIRR